MKNKRRVTTSFVSARAPLFAVILLSSITLSFLAGNCSSVRAQTQNSLVFDDFDGVNLDLGKWTIEQDTKESSGSVTVADSCMSLDSDGGGFPRVVSAVNPFPSTGDFAVEFDITYTRITDMGTGIWISQGPFVPVKDHVNANIMQVWASTIDGVTVNFFGNDVYQDDLYTHPTPFGYWNTSKIEIRLQYSKGIYTLFTNGVEVTSFTSDLRPDVFGFGCPSLPGNSNSYRVWSKFKTDAIRILPSAGVTLSSCPSVNLGLKVDVNGVLTDENEPLSGATIILSYLIPEVTTWMPITSVTTNAQGAYVATWNPTATGTYLLKAEWRGDRNHGGTHEIINVSVARGTDESLFLAESNSTLSSLAFNSDSKEISFTASGPSGTTGYVRFVISKTLLENLADFKVYLDGQQVQFTAKSEDDTQVLFFQYNHSAHNILIKMLTPEAPLHPDLRESPVTIALPILIIITVLISVFIKKRRGNVRKISPNRKLDLSTNCPTQSKMLGQRNFCKKRLLI